MRRIPNVFNKEELTKLFEIIQEPDLMMMCFIALFCGLRISEVLRLRKQDFDFYKKEVKILNSKSPTKNRVGYGKDRIVPLPDYIISVLQKWFDIIQEKEFIFPSIEKYDKPVCKSYMQKRYWSALKKANLRIPIGKNSAGNNIYKYNFHTFRHTYATILWEKTSDIYLVKNALGHSRLNTTMIYTHATSEVLKKKINEAFGKRERNFDVPQIIQHKAINFIGDSPLDILKLRVARGEIALSDFNNIRQAISSSK